MRSISKERPWGQMAKSVSWERRRLRILKEHQRKVLFEAVRRWKEKHGCADCRRMDLPYFCLELDHLPQYTKLANVSRLIRDSVSIERLSEEISKCQVVCVLCHRIRTYSRAVKCGKLPLWKVLPSVEPSGLRPASASEVAQ